MRTVPEKDKRKVRGSFLEGGFWQGLVSFGGDYLVD